MKINVFDNGGITCDRYTVFINKHVYYMSYYPDRANEVNQYGGEFKSNRNAMIKFMEELHLTKINKIPKHLKYAIKERCKQCRSSSY